MPTRHIKKIMSFMMRQTPQCELHQFIKKKFLDTSNRFTETPICIV